MPGLVLLIAVAAGVPGKLDGTIARTLHAIGWRNGDGSPITDITAGRIARGTRAALQRLDTLPGKPSRRNERVTPDGVAFARAALRTWP